MLYVSCFPGQQEIGWCKGTLSPKPSPGYWTQKESGPLLQYFPLFRQLNAGDQEQ